MRNTIVVLSLLLFAGLASGQTCTPVAVDTWANPSDDGHGPTEIFRLHRVSTNTDWYGTIYPGNPNAGPINAAADTYTYWVEFGANGEGYTTLRSGFGGCQLSTWGATEYTGLSVKDLNTGVLTNFPHLTDFCQGSGFWCKFDFIDGNHQITLVSGHDYMFYAGIESIVQGVGNSGNWTYSLRVNVQ